MTFRAVLFDLDGTLIDSVPLIVASMQHAFAGRERAPTVKEWVALIGTPLEAMIRRWGEDEADVALLRERYKEHQWAHHDSMVRAFPGRSRGAGRTRRPRRAHGGGHLQARALGATLARVPGAGTPLPGRGRPGIHRPSQARPGAGASRARPARGGVRRRRLHRRLAARRAGGKRRRRGHGGRPLGALHAGRTGRGTSPGLGGKPERSPAGARVDDGPVGGCAGASLVGAGIPPGDG